MKAPAERRRPHGAVALLLDEMQSPVLARALRAKGHDVVAAAEQPELRSMSDPELFEWAGAQRRRIVTENVKDFRPLLLQAREAAPTAATYGVLFTSHRSFPRSRHSPRRLIVALDAWLSDAGVADRPLEDWLRSSP